MLRFLDRIGRAAPQSLHHPLKMSGQLPLLWLGYRRRQQLRTSPQRESPPDSPNPLRTYFDAVRDGPGILKWLHYFEVYDRHFRKFRGQEVNILEIGVYSGGSLAMWRDYFGPKCRVYGVDIDQRCKKLESESVKVFIGDQGDREFWKRFKAEVPTIDILIDDGGHQTYQQIVTFEEMLSHLQPGGVFLCEDLTGEFSGFVSYLNGFVHKLNAYHLKAAREDHERYLTSQASELQSHVRAVAFYPFVTVVEKRERPLTEFVAQKHGTLWGW
jgi:SAM-dependent methyltransferase